LPIIGHGDYPPDDNWQRLTDEVIESIRSNTSRPVIGLGHSMGGVLTLMAAEKAPELFSMVIMLDSPLFNRVKSLAVKAIKHLGFADKFLSLTRINRMPSSWQSVEALRAYFQSKSVYSLLPEAAISDFVEHGLIKNSAGEYCVRFDREIEYAIYRTFPHHLPDSLVITRPVVLIYGADSDVVTPGDLHHIRQRYRMQLQQTVGGHMFPLEYPEITHTAIMEAVSWCDSQLDAEKPAKMKQDAPLV